MRRWRQIRTAGPPPAPKAVVWRSGGGAVATIGVLTVGYGHFIIRTTTYTREKDYWVISQFLHIIGGGDAGEWSERKERVRMLAMISMSRCG